MTESRPEKILEKLRETFSMPMWTNSGNDPFKMLTMTVISQNTSDRNTARAFENLSNRFKIAPEALANAEIAQIEQCLKVGGLYKNKAETIKQMSKIILEQYHGDLEPILSLPLEEARRTLMQLPGVGPKTADVMLLFCRQRPTIPIDTHVNRVAKRLGLAPANGDYETIRKALQALYNPKAYLDVHIFLISHGRKYCKARTPLCKTCPVSMFCPSRHLWDKDD